MIEREVGPWRYRCDPEATRAVYQRVKTRGAEECGCLACQNFLAAWSSTIPDLVGSFLESLGVDPAKEAEVIHYGEYGEDPTFYGWWYHAVGQVDEEWDESFELKSNGFELTETVSLMLSNRSDLAFPEFEGAGLFQVELFAHMPWLVKKRRKKG